MVRIYRAKAPNSHPPTLHAAINAMFNTSLTLDTAEVIWIGRSIPVKIGPITVAPAISCISFTEIDA